VGGARASAAITRWRPAGRRARRTWPTTRRPRPRPVPCMTPSTRRAPRPAGPSVVPGPSAACTRPSRWRPAARSSTPPSPACPWPSAATSSCSRSPACPRCGSARSGAPPTRTPVSGHWPRSLPPCGPSPVPPSNQPNAPPHLGVMSTEVAPSGWLASQQRSGGDEAARTRFIGIPAGQGNNVPPMYPRRSSRDGIR
jgi:hypothetical protein